MPWLSLGSLLGVRGRGWGDLTKLPCCIPHLRMSPRGAEGRHLAISHERVTRVSKPQVTLHSPLMLRSGKPLQAKAHWRGSYPEDFNLIFQAGTQFSHSLLFLCPRAGVREARTMLRK